ncbi:hypothetical protein RD792_004111 [Penstemon davidsonii]|uniref:TF-B3 domain-containing protein n=1 Tax=Penstemon davidsonii TaxID=160366 RepID=A0ABR0DHP6_9LAMI|nr:hypothetical protein RD792_004111 [Penstemon davidsonii]
MSNSARGSDKCGVYTHITVYLQRIPPEFTRRYGGNLPNHIFLKAPSGSLWEVELTHSRGQIYFHKGWKEFKDYYSLELGHFLVFEYDMKSQFHVLIFDFTASEIDYPFHANHDRHIEPKIEDIELESESDDSIVFLGEYSTIPENNESVQIPEQRSTRQETRRTRAEADDSVEVSKLIQLRKPTRRFRNCFPRGQKEKDSSSKKPTSRKNESGKIRPKRMNLNQVHSTKEVQRKFHMDTSMAYQRAKSFMADNPSQNISFISLMHPSYVSKSNDCRLRVPIVMAREILHEKYNDVKLRVSKGKIWQVKCSLEASRSRITSGWKSFVQDNALKAGDACVFKVNKSNNLIWNVTIFRSNHNKGRVQKTMNIGSESEDSIKVLTNKKKRKEESLDEADETDDELPLARAAKKSQKRKSDVYHPKRDRSEKLDKPTIIPDSRKEARRQSPKKVRITIDKETSMAYQTAKAFKADNTCQDLSFVVFMHPSYVSYPFSMTVPTSIVRENVPDKKNLIKLRGSDGKVWFVKCSLCNGYASIACGWKDFVQENTIQVGDACVFEVNKSDKLLWNVTIFRS